MKYQVAFFVLFPLLVFSQYQNRVLITVKAPFYEGKELMVEPCLSEIHGPQYGAYLIEKAESQKFNVHRVQNGTFSFWVNSNYPIPFYISFLNESTGEINFSDLFFVSTTNSQVSIGNLSKSKKVRIAQPNQIDKEWDSIRNQWKGWEFYELDMPLIIKRQEWVASYIQANPSSFVAMWLVIIDYENDRVSQEVKQNAALFSKEILELQPFKKMIFFSDNQVKLNEVVPFDLLSFGQELKDKVKENKWVFVDLWATSCKPCLQQFPELKQIHAVYKDKGIAFVSLTQNSPDESQQVDKVLRAFGASWSNYYATLQDSHILGNNHIPYGILINHEGKVLFVDLKLSELKTFLFENVD